MGETQGEEEREEVVGEEGKSRARVNGPERERACLSWFARAGALSLLFIQPGLRMPTL